MLASSDPQSSSQSPIHIWMCARMCANAASFLFACQLVFPPIVMQDDCESAALFHRENWVSIRPFSHHSLDWREDTALLDILDFLTEKVRGGGRRGDSHGRGGVLCNVKKSFRTCRL